MKKVVIVGKPNVGKSSLFNRIIGYRKAIVGKTPGITRDRNYAIAEWQGKKFYLIDTGGIINNKQIPYQEVINQQVNIAIDEADIILFVISDKDIINEQDLYIAKKIKTFCKTKKIILVLNKAENYDHSNDKQYYNFKLGNFYPISCAHSIGIGDLLDQIVTLLNKTNNEYEKECFKFCIIGRPNVGKSSLVNAIVHQKRVIVSDKPNTTRDAIDCNFKYQNKNFTIIDTAGIHKKSKNVNDIDKYSYLKMQQAISRANLIVLMFDGSNSFNELDKTIAGLAYEANIPTIICVNKWDLIKKNSDTTLKFTKLIRTNFIFLSWAPIIFISAKENDKISNIFSTIYKIIKNTNKKIPNSSINEIISKAQILNPAPKFKGGRLTIYSGTQVESSIPTFILFCNNPKYLYFSYARYIENQIRQAFELTNVPITIYYKDKNARTRK